MGKLACFGVGALEYIVPGAGYGITGQWDKVLLMGGSRWIIEKKAFANYISPYYQPNIEDIYKTTSYKDSQSGKDETKIYFNKETWLADYYFSLDSNLIFTSWGDLYQSGCKESTELYSNLLAPFNVSHFYNKLSFWIPIALVLGSNQSFNKNNKVEYFLGNGLTESNIRQDSFSQFYFVGLGEEMIFRATIQDALFYTYKDSIGISQSWSRHLSIYSASIIFGFAHNGSGFSAQPLAALLFGVYQGYVYHPSDDEFDLTTAIAIHSWWDLIVTYTILNNAKFNESENAVSYPLMNISFNF